MYVRLCDLQIPTVIDDDIINEVIFLYLYIIKKEYQLIPIFILVQCRMKMWHFKANLSIKV